MIPTHLHWDHCYNLDRFPAARILVQAADVILPSHDPEVLHHPIYPKR